jgi:type IV pilus assembly protein PilE
MRSNKNERLCMEHKRHSGFTLVEVMVVVAIVGILSAIAYPAYTQYVQRSYRAEGRNMLLEATQFMEKNYTLTQSYAVAAAGGALGDASLVTAGLSKVPRDGGTVRYTITFSVAPTAAAYTLVATPEGPQASDPCGALTLNNLQVKSRSGSAPSVAECWTR